MACKCVKPRYSTRLGRAVDGAWEEAQDTLDEPAACGECGGEGVEVEDVWARIQRRIDDPKERARRAENVERLMQGRPLR